MKTTKKERRIIGFLALLLALTVGYALLSQTLDINGTTNIKSSNWSIIWDNVQVKDGSVSGDSVTTAAQITNTEKTLVEYSISLSEPGEFYEFTVDAKNEGTIDGMVNTVSNKVYESNGTTEKALPEYLTYTVTYSDGKTIEPKHLLSAGSTEKYKVRVEFKDVSADKLPSQNETLKFKFEVEYVQADDSAQTIRLTGTRYTRNIYDTSKPVDNCVVFNQTMPSHITFYETVSDVKAAFNNKPFYLKHEIENDIVKDSYVCFEKDSNTYCLQGQHTYQSGVPGNCKSEYYDSENNKCISTYYESNKTILKNAFGESNCTQYSSNLGCRAGGLDIYADENGSVSAIAISASAHCDVRNDGVSYCRV